MKWILYLMLFSSPAQNVTDSDDQKCLALNDISRIERIEECRPHYEGSRVWSLQGTSQTEFVLFESCLRMYDQLLASSNVASTMAVRSWCICESEGVGKCPTQADLIKAATEIRRCEREDTPSCQSSNTKSIQSFVAKSGLNSSTFRLYPPLSAKERAKAAQDDIKAKNGLQ